MKHHFFRWKSAAAFLLVLLAVASGSVWFIKKYFLLEANALVMRIWPPPSTQQAEERQLRKIAGWFSRDCGHVPRHGDADAAIACANAAMKAGQRFYVSFDYVGLDSHGTTGLARDSQRRVYEVTADELGQGAFGSVATAGRVLNVTVTSCETAPIERTSYPANRYLTCHAD
jgi:hypothetical protein